MGTCKEWQNPSLNSGLCPHLVEGDKQVSGAEPVGP